jgi:hypothetical protein
MNTTGQIKMLHSGKRKNAGNQQIQFSVSTLNRGLYFILVKTQKQIYAAKMVLE